MEFTHACAVFAKDSRERILAAPIPASHRPIANAAPIYVSQVLNDEQEDVNE